MSTPGSPNSCDAAHQKLHGHQRFAAARAAAHQRGPAQRQATFGDFIEAVDAGGGFGQLGQRRGGRGNLSHDKTRVCGQRYGRARMPAAAYAGPASALSKKYFKAIARIVN